MSRRSTPERLHEARRAGNRQCVVGTRMREELDDRWIDRAAGQTRQALLERHIKVLAGENAEGKLADDVYLERKRQLRSQIEGLERSARPGIPASRAVEWLRALSVTWQAAEVQEEKADLLHAIYDRIVGGRRDHRLRSAHT